MFKKSIGCYVENSFWFYYQVLILHNMGFIMTFNICIQCMFIVFISQYPLFLSNVPLSLSSYYYLLTVYKWSENSEEWGLLRPLSPHQFRILKVSTLLTSIVGNHNCCEFKSILDTPCQTSVFYIISSLLSALIVSLSLPPCCSLSLGGWTLSYPSISVFWPVLNLCSQHQVK